MTDSRSDIRPAAFRVAPGEARAQAVKTPSQAAPSLLLTLWRSALLAIAAFVLGTAAWSLVYAVAAPPATLLMVQEQARLGAISHKWAPLEEIPDHVRRSMVAAEDARFCRHVGVDVNAISKALADFRAGRKLRGASTISQQTAKNVFLWSERSFVRKALEVWFTALIEASWSKQRILEVYLNVAEFGPGVFGVAAASERFFRGPPRAISEAQAARLATVLPAPRARDPNALSAALRKRARAIEVGANDIALTGAAKCFTG